MSLSSNFALFDKKSSDLYDTFKQNVVGGPSIIFNRHAKAGETFIRNNQNKLCQRIRGDDANALYLWAIGQEMPVVHSFDADPSKASNPNVEINGYPPTTGWITSTLKLAPTFNTN